MTLPRLAAIQDRWERVPPLTTTVASIAVGMGMKMPRGGAREAPAQAANDEEMGDLVAMMGGVTEMPEWLKKAMSQS